MGRVVLVGENPYGCGTEYKMSGVLDWQSDPTRGQRSSKMPVRKDRHIALHAMQRTNNAVRSLGYLIGHFTPRTAIAKLVPARTRLQNLRRGHSFIVAVVPFH